MKHLIVGIAEPITAEQADRIKTAVERHVGIPVVVIGDCSAIAIVDTADAIDPDDRPPRDLGYDRG